MARFKKKKPKIRIVKDETPYLQDPVTGRMLGRASKSELKKA